MGLPETLAAIYGGRLRKIPADEAAPVRGKGIAHPDTDADLVVAIASADGGERILEVLAACDAIVARYADDRLARLLQERIAEGDPYGELDERVAAAWFDAVWATTSAGTPPKRTVLPGERFVAPGANAKRVAEKASVRDNAFSSLPALSREAQVMAAAFAELAAVRGDPAWPAVRDALLAKREPDLTGASVQIQNAADTLRDWVAVNWLNQVHDFLPDAPRAGRELLGLL